MSYDWQPHMMPSLAIHHMARMIGKISDERLKQAGITASQLPVLVALKNGEQRTQKELAQIASVEQPSMAQLLARMERDGMIRRVASPDDKRSSLILLTDKALALLQPGRDILRELDQQICAGLSEADQQILLELLGRMFENIDTLQA